LLISAEAFALLEALTGGDVCDREQEEHHGDDDVQHIKHRSLLLSARRR
jgi:hypothetical protein